MFLEEVKSFLSAHDCPFESYELPDHTMLLHISESIQIHLIPIILKNKTLYTANQYTQKLSDTYAEKGCLLIHLWEDLWIHKKEIVQSRILSTIGKSQRIHARKTVLKKVSKSMAEDFLAQNHLNDHANSSYRYALYYQDEPVSIITFGHKVRFNPRKFSFNIIRYCSRNGYTVIGGLSKLIKGFKNEHNPGHLMTYIDKDWASGKGFETLGFEHEKHAPPTYYYLNWKEKKRYYPQRIDSSSFKDNPNWIKIYNAGSIKLTWEDE